MNMFSPAEVVANYATAGKKKSEMRFFKLLILSILAGLFIALGSAVTNTAAHSIANVSAARIISGLLFPFGLGMVVLTGAELFTGNCLITISVLEKQASVFGMFRNWIIVYIGNFLGGIILAASCAYFGQLEYSAGGLAVFTIKLAAAKCSIPFWNCIVLGIFANLLVCAGVICSMSGKDTFGKIAGAYIPVAFFVICGFEHCIANMYFIPAGLFANSIPKYAELAKAAGIDTSLLTWGNFFLKNLLPVTIGNIIGGAGLGILMQRAYKEK